MLRIAWIVINFSILLKSRLCLIDLLIYLTNLIIRSISGT